MSRVDKEGGGGHAERCATEADSLCLPPSADFKPTGRTMSFTEAVDLIRAKAMECKKKSELEWRKAK